MAKAKIKDRDDKGLLRLPDSNTFLFRLRPKDERELIAIANEVIKWARKDDSLCMTSFYDKMGLTSSRVHKWAKDCEYLAEALIHARELIGARRELGGLTGKFNPAMVLAYAPLYCEDLRNWKRECMSKKNEQHERPVINVIMEEYKLPEESDAKKGHI